HFGDLLAQEWPELAPLQAELDERAAALLRRLKCPATGTTVAEALRAERLHLQPLRDMEAPYGVVVSRRVSQDCPLSSEGRLCSVPFHWVGRTVEVLGTHAEVIVRAGGEEIARHPRHTAALLVLDPAHFEGSSTDRVLAPTPLGRRARLQLA